MFSIPKEHASDKALNVQFLLWYSPMLKAEFLQFSCHIGISTDVDVFHGEVAHNARSDILHVAVVPFPCIGGFAEDGVEGERGMCFFQRVELLHPEEILFVAVSEYQVHGSGVSALEGFENVGAERSNARTGAEEEELALLSVVGGKTSEGPLHAHGVTFGKDVGDPHTCSPPLYHFDDEDEIFFVGC